MSSSLHAFASLGLSARGVFAFLGMGLSVVLCLFWLRRRAQDPTGLLRMAMGALILGSLGAFSVAALERGIVGAELQWGMHGSLMSGLGLGVLGAWLWARWQQRSPWLLIGLVLAAPFGISLARVGCFLEGCCFGSPTDFFHLGRHPAVLYESALMLALGGLLWWKAHKPGSHLLLPWVFLVSVAGIRLVLMFFRGDLLPGPWGGLLAVEQVEALVVGGLSLLGLGLSARRAASYAR